MILFDNEKNFLILWKDFFNLIFIFILFYYSGLILFLEKRTNQPLIKNIQTNKRKKNKEIK